MKRALLQPLTSNSVWQNSYKHVIISLDGGRRAIRCKHSVKPGKAV